METKINKEFNSTQPIEYFSNAGIRHVGFVEGMAYRIEDEKVYVLSAEGGIYKITINQFNTFNILNKVEIMSSKTEKPEGTTKTPKADIKTAPKKEAATATPKAKTAPKAKATPKKEKATPKKDKAPKAKKAKIPGVKATILKAIQEKGPITEEGILKILAKTIKDRNTNSMANTIKVQIRGKKRPLRMEREKDVTFVIVESKEKNQRTYAIKK